MSLKTIQGLRITMLNEDGNPTNLLTVDETGKVAKVSISTAVGDGDGHCKHLDGGPPDAVYLPWQNIEGGTPDDVALEVHRFDGGNFEL